MNLHTLHDATPEWLAPALADFEKQFRYPLGENESFHISHGRDYTRFFRAIGDATVFVAEQRGEVLGTLAGVRRPLRFPDGAVRDVAYICDYKVRPGAGAGRVLIRLGKALEHCFGEAVGGRGYGVVMGGSRRAPEDYTGRCGIPDFQRVGGITILRFETAAGPSEHSASIVSAAEWPSLIVHDAFVPLGGNPATRSSLPPVSLLLDDGQACGVVEDTRRGKRLLRDENREMKAAHLSQFAYREAAAGAALIRAALVVGREAGYPALFVSISARDTAAFRDQLRALHPLEAPAAIYACGLESGRAWHVASSEI